MRRDASAKKAIVSAGSGLPHRMKPRPGQPKNMTAFYRFRSIANLLGEYKELERQSIYFASPEQLNDPMEGYRDFFWSGDRIAWRNLFRHYLLCLEHTYTLLLISGDGHVELSVRDLPVFVGMNSFPTDQYRARFHRIQQQFFGREDVAKYIDGIANSGRNVRRDELRFHLQNVHFAAFESIARTSEIDGVMARQTSTFPDSRVPIARTGVDFFRLLSEVSAESGKGEEAVEALFQASAHVRMQTGLISRYNQVINTSDRNKNFALLDFPDNYLKAIERLVFPDWYTACFMSECCNSSVWGHYCASHTSVCLIFESDDVGGSHYLPLNGYNAMSGSGPMKGLLRMQFHPVAYTEGFEGIDFNRSLGRMPMSTVMSTWYSDEAGNVSDCAQPVLDDQDGWRRRYWNSFLPDILRKTKDWAYEHEHRLILFGSVIDYSDSQYRTLSYEFSSLKGLIFGINTRTEDKLEIMRIIDCKCAEHGRTDFKFYQAYYSPRERHVGHVELDLLRRQVP